jgi:hypothetical protein
MKVDTAFSGTLFVIGIYVISILISCFVAGLIYLLSRFYKQNKVRKEEKSRYDGVGL